MNKNYKLIVQHDFSLANETDADIHSDYSPGIWAISSQSRILKYAKELLAKGDSIKVSCYDNPEYYALSNKFIKELGLAQELFSEIAAVPASKVTNGKPFNLSQLKKLLQVGIKIRVKSRPDAHGVLTQERETVVTKVQGNAITTEKAGGASWIYWGNASEWSFDNEGATHWFIGRYDELKGKQTIDMRIDYLA